MGKQGQYGSNKSGLNIFGLKLPKQWVDIIYISVYNGT